jgi:hypothetical protein
VDTLSSEERGVASDKVLPSKRFKHRAQRKGSDKGDDAADDRSMYRAKD